MKILFAQRCRPEPPGSQTLTGTNPRCKAHRTEPSLPAANPPGKT